jgi:hypothetical protein
MRSWSPYNLIRKRQLWRGVALFFLLFTAADILCPALCRGEELTAGLGSEVINAADQEAAATAATPRLSASGGGDHWPAGPEGQPPLDEDCFCCCAHIVQGTAFLAGSVIDRLLLDAPGIDFLPSSPPRSPFHPPRSV